MSKRCILLDPACHSAADVCVPIDWSKCILCQKQTREPLQCPANSRRQDVGAGYHFLAIILPQFDNIGRLPPGLVISRIDEGDGLQAALQRNQAKYHKSCRSNFSRRELTRKSVEATNHSIISVDDPTELSDTFQSDLVHEVKRVCTRSQFDSENVLRAKIPVCFFCDLPANDEILHEVATLDLGRKIAECALTLADDRLLAKLAINDMISQEAKYHQPCLTNLYNRRRSLERERFREVGSSPCVSAHSTVFAELTAYINDVRKFDGIIPVFKLADLKKMYTSRLQQLSDTELQPVHGTRLKEKLLAYYPDLRAHSSGRDVILAFDKNVGAALTKACSNDIDDDALHLARAAEIVRREMFTGLWQFKQTFAMDCQMQSIPHSLLTLVKMILEGPSIDIQSLQQGTSAAVTVAQLIVFNSVRHKRRDDSSASCISTAVRHAKEQETPLPLYLGLAVHAATRKKRLVDKLFDLGLSVSYDRVLSVLNGLAEGVSNRFQAEKAVCPPNFKSGLFTTAAVDNIDHNLSSTHAQNSFHGTGISLHQHMDSTMSGTNRNVAEVNCSPAETSSKSAVCLPASYTMIPPTNLLNKEPSVPLLCMGTQEVELISTVNAGEHLNENAWLDCVWNSWQAGTFVTESVSSWSAFHATRMTKIPNMAIVSMLPLFQEHAQSVAMIRHTMDIIHSSVTTLNSSQVPVIAFDQPLYTLAKVIQWNWPDAYGEHKFLVMFGGLHVEMAALKALGSLLTGSGWVEAISGAGIVSAGSAEGLLSASHVRRCRRTHEITLAALYIMQRLAFSKTDEAVGSLPFDDWCKHQATTHHQFAFWTSVMKLQTAILLFVCSLRESNFNMYVDSLIDLMPWFFVLDRTNYARWLSVRVRDMCELSKTHPDIYAEFQKGKFTVNKTGNTFSAMPLDQAHEQLNATLKGDGGIIGLTNNDAALNRWIVSGPEVARLIVEFDSQFATSNNGHHHEQQPAVQQAFINDVQKLANTMLEMGNPFEDQHDLIVLHSRRIVAPEIAELSCKLFEMGKDQFDYFVKTRLNSNSESLFAPLKRNKLAFFTNAKQSAASKAKSAIIAAKNDSALFSRLYIACQIRSSDLDEFFAHENQPYPPSLSSSGSLHFGSKSDLLSCLEILSPSVQTAPNVTAVILDGSVVVNMLKPSNEKTFGDYVTNKFMPYIYSYLSKSDRVDVVWDRYDPDSIKGIARTKRGSGVRQQVISSAPVPRNWHEFLRCNDNKTALFSFLADEMCQKPVSNGKLLVGTCGMTVKSSDPSYVTAPLEPCAQEEADTRMILHAAEMVKAGNKRILLRTVDTDVVVLAIAFYSRLACDELWIAFGTGQHLRYIPAHDIAVALGPQQSIALPVFHAFTGCDTVSAFVGRGKKTCWEVWKKYPDVTESLTTLFCTPDRLSDGSLTTLQRFVVLLYDTNCSCFTVNSARKKLFANKGKSIEQIPPTLDALVQHTRRAVYQAGHIWSQSLLLQPKLPSPGDWGWQLVDNSWQPVWTTLPDAAKCCPELKRCGCKTGCVTKRCKCVKDKLECTALCACDGECRL